MNEETPNNTEEDDKPLVPRAGVIYGDIIYWGTIVGTFFVMLGSVVTFVTTNNYIDPAYLLSAIIDGATVENIWKGAEGVNQLPNGHWYLSEVTTGNGLTMLGIAMGVFSVTPAIFAAAYVLFKEGQKLFGGIAVVAGLITIFAMMP